MSREQADRLAQLMRDQIGERAPAVLNAMLLWDPSPSPGVGQLIAVWESQEAWDSYLSGTAVPRATELMRAVGAEPTLRVVPVLELA